MLPFARDRYGERLDVRVFERAVALAQERATTLVQIAEQAEFLFVSDDAFVNRRRFVEKSCDHGARERGARRGDREFVEHCEWSDAIDVRPVITELGLKPGKVMHVLYTAIEGTSAGLPLFDSIALLGQRAQPATGCARPGRGSSGA